jgi:polyhydroxyalkanoate synthase
MTSSKQRVTPEAASTPGFNFQAALGSPADWSKTMEASLAKLGEMNPFFPPRHGQQVDLKQALEKLQLHIEPAHLLALQTDYTRNLATLWRDMVEGRPHDPPKDRRFGAPDWSGMHAYIAELYLLNSKFISSLADSVETDPKTKAKLQFATQQMIDAMSPANYLATNPEAIKKILDTQGESLQAGIHNMLADFQKGRISQSDETAFEIGRNVGTSAGAVVFENEIIQLIHYQPLVAQVHERPLLIIPPCINKFYILDLQAESSFVRYALEQGQNVFLVSWRNPTQEQAHLTWDDYVEEGAIRAIDVVRAVSKQKTINILGFCVGGTVLATALAVLAARGEQPAESLTLLTTFLDFSETGIMDVFIDEDMVHQQETSIGGLTAEGKPGGSCGLLAARDLAATFSFLRPNDLVWNYVVSNYLKGQTPMAFDLLYWNGDGTNIPGPFLAWYLRNTYLENNLKVPGKATVCGQPIDFGKINAPSYIYSSREDHIVPWTSAYASTQLLNGPKRFVIGASGHIAGVINPPNKKKRSYWAYAPLRGKFPKDPQVWLNAAAEIPGSWWPDWSDWLVQYASKKIKAPVKLGNTQYRPIEAAPGRYVKLRAM